MFELPRRRNELYIIHFCFILYNYRCFVVVFMMHLNVKLPYFLSVPVWFFSSVCTFEPWSSSFVNISRMHSGSEKGQGWKKDLCRLLTYLWRKLVNAVFHKALVILIKTLIYKKVLEILTKILGWQVFCFVFFFSCNFLFPSTVVCQIYLKPRVQLALEWRVSYWLSHKSTNNQSLARRQVDYDPLSVFVYSRDWVETHSPQIYWKALSGTKESPAVYGHTGRLLLD